MPNLNVLLIASGRGSDAFSIMGAWKQGWIPEVGRVLLVSTHEGAGCLEQAARCGVESMTLVPPNIPMSAAELLKYGEQLKAVVMTRNIRLVFLVGCNVILPIIEGVMMLNIHPADPVQHGGSHMHGRAVHEHVLTSIMDEIHRDRKNAYHDRFFTYPTVHEVIEAVDGGQMFSQTQVEIPREILLGIQGGKHTMEEAAAKLQQVVLPYEWMMLPTAVRMAAQRLYGA